MNALSKLRVVLGAKKNNIPLFIVVLQAIYTAMSTHSSTFSSPPVALAVFLKQIQDLQASQALVKKGPAGSASTRNSLRDAAFISVEALRVYVQGLCDQASPEQAMSLIQAAGFRAAKPHVQTKPLLGVTLVAGQPGSVLAKANATLLGAGRKKRRFFGWSYTVDGGKTWVEVASTVDAHTTITGLPLLTLCGFRVRVTTPSGQGDWSPMIDLLVH